MDGSIDFELSLCDGKRGLKTTLQNFILHVLTSLSGLLMVFGQSQMAACPKINI
jgi:hypothetical protein